MIEKLDFKLFASEHDKSFQLQDKVNEIIAAVNAQELAIKNSIKSDVISSVCPDCLGDLDDNGRCWCYQNEGKSFRNPKGQTDL